MATALGTYIEECFRTATVRAAKSSQTKAESKWLIWISEGAQ